MRTFMSSLNHESQNSSGETARHVPRRAHVCRDTRGSKSDLHSDFLIAWQPILTCSNALVNCGNPAVTSHCASHSPSRRTRENIFINYCAERSFNECRRLDMQKITQIIDVRQGRRLVSGTKIAISPRLHAAAIRESISGEWQTKNGRL